MNTPSSSLLTVSIRVKLTTTPMIRATQKTRRSISNPGVSFNNLTTLNYANKKENKNTNVRGYHAVVSSEW